MGVKTIIPTNLLDGPRVDELPPELKLIRKQLAGKKQGRPRVGERREATRRGISVNELRHLELIGGAA